MRVAAANCPIDATAPARVRAVGAVFVFLFVLLIGNFPPALRSTGTQEVWQYAYDAAGNRTSRQDALGRTITYGYDAVSRLRVLADSATGGESLGVSHLILTFSVVG